MKRWEQLLFGVFSFAILLIIGFKLHELDMPTARFVRSFNIGIINRIGDFIAVAGKGVVLTGLFILIGLVGWWLKKDLLKEIGVRGVIALLWVTLVVQLLKHLIGRPRPRFAHADQFILGPSLGEGLDSFPSGHAINGFAAAAVVGWFLPRLRVPLFLLGGLVGISRVVRGSHFPTDVYIGAILGLVIGTLVAAGFKHWKDSAFPQLIQIAVPWIVVLFCVIWIMLHSAPPWPQELLHLVVGIGLILLGMLLRSRVILRREPHRGMRAAGNITVGLGVVVACGPWWMAGLIVAAFLPYVTGHHRHDTTFLFGLFGKRETGTVSRWRGEALAASAAMLGIVVLWFLQGLLPLAS
jgi:membrane-associated phospholipid phosphatase